MASASVTHNQDAIVTEMEIGAPACPIESPAGAGLSHANFDCYGAIRSVKVSVW
jgi:hypothetical protein